MTRYVTLRNSQRPEPTDGTSPLGIDEPPLCVSVYLRGEEDRRYRIGSRAALAELTTRREWAELAADRNKALSEAAAQISDFAQRQALAVLSVDLAGRRIQLRGQAHAMEVAFRTSLRAHEHRGRRHRFPTRPIRIPHALRHSVLAVVGLDERPQHRRVPHAAVVDRTSGGLLPREAAALYGMGTGGNGAGQCIGIIQPAGGYHAADLAAAFAGMGIPVPQIVEILVGAGRNAFGDDIEADKEVALDMQIAGAVAPEARLVVYFTENSDEGLVGAVTTAVHDVGNRPSVLISSWGDAEANWSEPARRAMDAVLGDAARLGITVVAATGDGLATDGLMDGRAHVDYPASSPYVLACGGTRANLTDDRRAIASEVVWNNGVSGTGGGISDVCPVPAYQAGVTLPASVNDGARRRGTPDLAVLAAPTPGYRIIVRGTPVVAGGTSAAAPLFGGFLALVNEQRGRSVGLINDVLYQQPGLFRPVPAGDNKPFGSEIGYEADMTWCACTGLGTPIGAAIIRTLTAIV